MDYFDLGSFRRPVSTDNHEAQTWFDRGLLWTYAFHHEAAVACFERAANLDPDCAMAHWGIAYAVGPNYNHAWPDFELPEKVAMIERATAALARATAGRATPIEAALIAALAARLPPDAALDDFTACNDAYADAMRAVYRRFSDDLDVASLFAEALMNRTPWQLWDLPTGQPTSGADTLEAAAALEQAFEVDPASWQHPGLLHMYIHLMEMSPHPERALRHGDALTGLAPAAGHLQHMATHIDALCGDYANVVERNHAAILADQAIVAYEGADNFYSLYRCHNYHFKIYGAMFLAQPERAFEAANELIASLPPATLLPMADWLESFVPMKQHVLVRFGRWDEILAQPLPTDQTLFCYTTAIQRYARAIALANTGAPAAADAERQAFYDAVQRVPETRMLFNNTCQDILRIAGQMMDGELAYHRSDYDAAFEHLRASVALDDALPYDEPWGWMQPTRHALGALLLEQEHNDEAEAVYRADLGLDPTLPRACQHPNNVWSLHGLDECLSRRGDQTERALIQPLLARALARATVPIAASCFCRHNAA